MLISCTGADYRCDTLQQFREKLCEIMAYDSEIWLSCGSYPALSILVCGKEAALNYFLTGDGEMYASVGDISRGGVISLSQYDVAEYQLIPLQMALKCAAEFYENQALPTSAEWEEL